MFCSLLRTIFVFFIAILGIVNYELCAANSTANVDSYGIPMVLLDNPQMYLSVLKEKISQENKYSKKLYLLLEKHYIFLIADGDSTKKYLEFYGNLIKKSSDDALKNAFYQRYCRAILRSGYDKNTMAKTIKSLAEKVVTNPYERNYNLILQTYISQNYEEAIEALKGNEIFYFDLSCLYNNYAATLAKSDPNKSLELLRKGILTANEPELLKNVLLPSLQFVLDNQQISPNKFFNTLLSDISGLPNKDNKVVILTIVLAQDNFITDVRLQRKYIDMLISELKGYSNQWTKAQALYLIAMKEFSLNNNIDADEYFKAHSDICRKNNWGNELLHGELMYIYCLKDRMSKNIEDPNEKLISMVDRIVVETMSLNRKCRFLTILTQVILDLKYWKTYAEINKKLKEYGLYIEITKNIVNDSILPMIKDSEETNKFSHNEIKDVIKSIPAELINQIHNEDRNFIATYLSVNGEYDLATQWRPASDDSFMTQIKKAEDLSYRGNTLALNKALTILDNLRPKAFTYKKDKFSKIDAEAILLNQKLAIHLQNNSLFDIANCKNDLEKIIPDCSESFQKYYYYVASGNIGIAYTILGFYDKGIKYLAETLSEFPQEDIYLGVFSLNLGMAYIQKQNWRAAEPHIKKATEVFKKLGNVPYYVRASIKQAAVAVEFKLLTEAEILLNNSMDWALKNNLHDDYVTAGMIKVYVIMENKNISRQEKISKVKKLFNKLVNSTENPTVLANLFFLSTGVKHRENFPVQEVIADAEKYFYYQDLFSDVFSMLSDKSLLLLRNDIMQNLLLESLSEVQDVKRLDFWNKKFEQKRTRNISIKSEYNKASVEIRPLLSIVAEFEAAQQILSDQRNKLEAQQDKKLIKLAAAKIRKLGQQKQAIYNSLSSDDKKVLDSLWADNFIIQPDSLGQLNEILPENVACMQYLLVGDKLIVYIVCKNATTPFVTSINLKDKKLSSKKLQGTTKQLLTLLNNNNPDKTSIESKSAILYNLFFPAEIEQSLQKLKVDTLIINASGFLRYIPFAAMYDGKQYLVEKYQITNITGRDLIRIAKASPKRLISKSKAVFFADPTGGEQPLPHSRTEAKKVAKMFKESKCYFGSEAILDNFRTILDANFIHLATHAKLDSEHPENSYILFADNQKWFYSDMTGFVVRNVDSIVLSACSTAANPNSNGSEIESMAYQLLRKSPSGSIVASFWDVDDGATAAFMQEYYQHIVNSIKKNGTLDRGGALRKAQLKLLRNKETSSPKYWAAFTLFGDFR